jgi:hypothetical protein
LVSTNKRDNNKGEVRTKSGEVHVSLNDEDLDLGTTAAVVPLRQR